MPEPLGRDLFSIASQAAPVKAARQDGHRYRSSCQTETVLRNIAVPALAPVPAFELGVVCEAFGLDRTPPGLPAYDFAVCGEQVTPVPTTSGFAVLPGHDLNRLAQADLIIVLGAAPPTPPPPAALVRQLRAAVARGATVASACTGAFVLAAAGLLNGRRVTTHWLHAPLLASLYPQLRVEADRLYIEDGPIVTSAGSAAVIDLCLHLIRREHGGNHQPRRPAHGRPAAPRRRTVPVHRDAGPRTGYPRRTGSGHAMGPAAPLRPSTGSHTRPIPPGLPAHLTRYQHSRTDRASGRTR
jgi:putative intracellular protease/amidase